MKIKPFIASVLISIALALFLRFGMSAYARLFIWQFEAVQGAWTVGGAMWVVVKSAQLSPLLYRLGAIVGIRYEWLALVALAITPIDIIITFKAFYWFSDRLELANILLSIGCTAWTGLVRLLVLQCVNADRFSNIWRTSAPSNQTFSVHPQNLAVTGVAPSNQSLANHPRSNTTPQFDLIAAMSKAPENTLILAPSESGKGIVIGNLIAAFKATTDCSVTAIDPKGAITEDGFFAQCDRVHRFKSQELDRDGIIAETKKGWKMFQQECRTWEGVKPCFILIDEMLVIGGCFSKAKDSFLQDKIASLVSMGRSQRQFCWIATQYPQLSELGIQGGIAGQLEMLIIARRKNATLIKPWGAKYDLTRAVDFREMDGCFDDSPVDRAVYWRGKWNPMPKMANLSGFDRETNTWIGNAAAPENSGNRTDLGVNARTLDVSAVGVNAGGGENSPPINVDYLDSLVADYFAAANPSPKSIKNIRDGSRVRDSRATVTEVAQSLDRLRATGQLVRYPDGWVLPSWIDNN